jgi:hypothetical protein
VKAAAIVAAVDGHEPARNEPDGAAQKGVHLRDLGMQIGEMKYALFANRDGAVPIPL